MLNLSWKTPRLSVIRAGVGLQCGLSGNSVPDVVTLRRGLSWETTGAATHGSLRGNPTEPKPQDLPPPLSHFYGLEEMPGTFCFGHSLQLKITCF